MGLLNHPGKILCLFLHVKRQTEATGFRLQPRALWRYYLCLSMGQTQTKIMTIKPSQTKKKKTTTVLKSLRPWSQDVLTVPIPRFYFQSKTSVCRQDDLLHTHYMDTLTGSMSDKLSSIHPARSAVAQCGRGSPAPPRGHAILSS